MNLTDIVSRTCPPSAWAEGETIPWSDPAFSRRMLREHLSQAHDGASRRFEIIDRHVAWIHHHLLSGQPSRVLDLGCGPGLYLQRLASLGHTCTGIDYSPSSLAHAALEAARAGLSIEYRQEDLRVADYGAGVDLVMLIFGELNVFRPADARRILHKAAGSLKDGGILLLEVHSFDAIQQRGRQRSSWYASKAGLFSDSTHLCLQENFWDPDTCTATTRYYIVDAASGGVSRHAESMQAYTDEEYANLLADSGFADRTGYPSLTGPDGPGHPDLMVLVSRK